MYLTENLLGRNKIWCAVGNHNYMCFICKRISLMATKYFRAVLENTHTRTHFTLG